MKTIVADLRICLGACPQSENRLPPRIKSGAGVFRDMR
jgi:hypothetical protein